MLRIQCNAIQGIGPEFVGVPANKSRHAPCHRRKSGNRRRNAMRRCHWPLAEIRPFWGAPPSHAPRCCILQAPPVTPVHPSMRASLSSFLKVCRDSGTGCFSFRIIMHHAAHAESWPHHLCGGLCTSRVPLGGTAALSTDHHHHHSVLLPLSSSWPCHPCLSLHHKLVETHEFLRL